jgi:uncharacterized membrane protein YsdA (DUF1294 family)
MVYENNLFILLYLFFNILAFIIYKIDKNNAISHKWRISENKLILCGIIGPFGAYTGMKIFHHKTRKTKFKILIPIFLIIHMLFIFYYFKIL